MDALTRQIVVASPSSEAEALSLWLCTAVLFECQREKGELGLQPRAEALWEVQMGERACVEGDEARRHNS